MTKKIKSSPKTTLRTMITDLPGLGNQAVIMSSPQVVKENSQHTTTEKKDK